MEEEMIHSATEKRKKATCLSLSKKVKLLTLVVQNACTDFSVCRSGFLVSNTDDFCKKENEK